MVDVVTAVQEKLERNKRRYTESLRSKADILRRGMEQLIREIDDGNLQLINSLGEVQGQGKEVDRLCAILSESLDMEEYVNAHVKMASEE